MMTHHDCRRAIFYFFKWLSFFLVVIDIFCPILHAIDGNITPTIINHRYQFSPGELAIGMVYFRQGFEVAPSDTAQLFLTPSVEINGDVYLNGGTLEFNRNASFGPGFKKFHGPGFINFPTQVQFAGDFGFTDTIYFIGDRTDFLAQSEVTVDLSKEGVLHFSGLTGALIMRNISLIVKSDSLITSSAFPLKILLRNVSLRNNNKTGDVRIMSPIVEASGFLRFQSPRNFIVIDQLLQAENGASILVDRGSNLRVGAINIKDANTELILNSAFLDCATTLDSSSTFSISQQDTRQGHIFFEGNYRLGSSLGQKILIEKNTLFECAPGARIIVEEGTHLSIL